MPRMHSVVVTPAKRACERIATKGCITVVRPSRRALWALLRMREAFDDIKKTPHPEERPSGPRLEGRIVPIQPTGDFFTASKAGIQSSLSPLALGPRFRGDDGSMPAKNAMSARAGAPVRDGGAGRLRWLE